MHVYHGMNFAFISIPRHPPLCFYKQQTERFYSVKRALSHTYLRRPEDGVRLHGPSVSITANLHPVIRFLVDVSSKSDAKASAVKNFALVHDITKNIKIS